MDQNLYRALEACFIHGDVAGAMELMAAEEELLPLYEDYANIFCREQYIHYPIPDHLDRVLLAYQQYYRNLFYLKQEETKAEADLLRQLQMLLSLPSAEEEAVGKGVEAAFQAAGYHALTGRTNGCFGPYVWKTTEPVTYQVELPEGTFLFTVNILKDFIFRSWIAYLTFGARGTGGWASPDGTINCVESAYDFESEAFRVSLLKHEAQHVQDLQRWPDMEPWLLEYRAKLVELIYSERPGLLEKFRREASPDRPNDPHAVASCRLMQNFGEVDPKELQSKARVLFSASEHLINNSGGALCY